MTQFHKLLRAARKMRGISQRELGERVGMKQTSISTIELGANAGVKTLIKLFDALGYEIHITLKPKSRGKKP